MPEIHFDNLNTYDDEPEEFYDIFKEPVFWCCLMSIFAMAFIGIDTCRNFFALLGGFLIFPIVYLVYSYALLRTCTRFISNGAIWISGLVGCVFILLSTLWFIDSQALIGKYVDHSTYYGYITGSVIFLLPTIGFYMWAIRSKAPDLLLVANAALFGWVLSFGFPYMGELP